MALTPKTQGSLATALFQLVNSLPVGKAASVLEILRFLNKHKDAVDIVLWTFRAVSKSGKILDDGVWARAIQQSVLRAARKKTTDKILSMTQVRGKAKNKGRR